MLDPEFSQGQCTHENHNDADRNILVSTDAATDQFDTHYQELCGPT